jgi:hypothetical protein
MESMLTTANAARRLLVAALVLAVASSATATFEAANPGELLAPTGDAAALVNLVQGQRSILWTSATGVVDTYRMVGWPVVTDDIEIGGALVMERVSADAGVIRFDERPMSLEFDLDG